MYETIISYRLQNYFFYRLQKNKQGESFEYGSFLLMNLDTWRGRQAESSALRRPENQNFGVIDVQNFQGRNQRGRVAKRKSKIIRGSFIECLFAYAYDEIPLGQGYRQRRLKLKSSKPNNHQCTKKWKQCVFPLTKVKTLYTSH